MTTSREACAQLITHGDEKIDAFAKGAAWAFQSQQQDLYAIVQNPDAMICQCDADNMVERSRNPHDSTRLQRYENRRQSLVARRNEIERVYVAIYDVNPWANVAF